MADPNELDGPRAPLVEHLRELRSRIACALLGFLLCAITGWVCRVERFDWLLVPYEAAMRASHPEMSEYVRFRRLLEPLVV